MNTGGGSNPIEENYFFNNQSNINGISWRILAPKFSQKIIILLFINRIQTVRNRIIHKKNPSINSKKNFLFLITHLDHFPKGVKCQRVVWPQECHGKPGTDADAKGTAQKSIFGREQTRTNTLGELKT